MHVIKIRHNFNPPTPVPSHTRPSTRNPCRRGHEIYNFGRPFRGYHYYIHVLDFSDPCHKVEKKRRNIAFSLTNIAILKYKNPCTGDC